MFSGPRESGDSAAIKKSSAPSKKQQLQQGLKGRDAAAAAGPGQQAGIRVRERKFENGDRYRGGWLNGLPEGEGKYEWSDGSGYEGGWKAGHKHGVGKYTWNSGASYQGEWSNGFMHGVGTFEAPDGSKYQGGWKEDLKHGLGRKIYANGDVYEGLWCTGKPDGPGRYIWVDFNEYDGEWRAGRLHGQGTFVWKTGERYDGEWKAGQEDGVGMFTFRDGSTFEGFWHRGKKHGVGIFRPATAPAASAMRSLKGRFESGGPSRASSTSQNASTGRSAFADATAAAAAMPDEAAADYIQNRQAAKPATATEPTTGEGQQQPRMSHQPGSAKSMSSMGQLEPGSLTAVQKPHSRKDQVMLKEYNEGRLVRQQVLSPADIATISSALCAPADMVAMVNNAAGSGSSRGSGSSNRQQQATALGDVTYKDHSAYDLMVQLQLGVRWSVTSAALDYTSPAALRSELQPPDYATTITQEFPRAGSRSTPVHPAADFVWKDYAPSAFRMLREAAGVEQHDFINQLCGDQAIRLLKPPGNSDAMFFLSADERFIVRTITLAEKKMLLSVLQRYTEHIRRYPKSLLTRFFGLHRVSAAAGGMGRKVRFLVMGNIFATQLPIQQRYDLKGCTKGRTVGAAAKGHSAQAVLKDLDLRQRFKLEQGSARRVHEQLDVDTRLLSTLRVMDYSMLLGVHQVAAAAASSEGRQVRSQPNFAEHSNAPGLSAAVSRLEAQLSRTKLDKWAQAALYQLACANLLMGLAAAGGRSGDSSSRRASITRSPALVLATRPRRIGSSRKVPSTLQPAGAAAAAAGPDAAIKAVGAGAEAGMNDDAAVKDASAAAAAAEDLDSKAGNSLMQPLGQGVSAVTMPLCGGEQQDVILYFGVIDILQGYTIKKRLESYMRRLVSSAHAISAVSPSFYAVRFRKGMKKVLL